MKAIISKVPSYQCGGVIPILNRLNELQIPELIGSCLGKRVKQAKYSYDDALISWMMTMFCHGFRISNIKNTEKDLSVIHELNIPSHDTIGRLMKGLATETEKHVYKNKKNPKEPEKTYWINENDKLNNLLLLCTKKMGLLSEGKPYILDIDATVIESEVHDANMTYKRFTGFTPMVCMIGNLPVYISMRSGNANPHYEKLDCLMKCLALLKEHNIKIETVRIDGAGYKGDILECLNNLGYKFIIGANWSHRTLNFFKESDWETKTFETSTHIWDGSQLASTNFSMANSKDVYNMCGIRIKDDNRSGKNSPTKWHLKDGYYYKFVITNTKDTSAFDTFKAYHERGTIEKNFDALKNDFGWRILPFSKLNHNLVYMIITALANNLFQGLLSYFSKKLKGVLPTIRLTSFRNLFIKVVFSIINDMIVFQSENIVFAELI